MREDVAFDFDARRHLHQFHAALSSFEHTTLGDVQHRLALLGGISAIERDLLDLAHELAAAAFTHDMK